MEREVKDGQLYWAELPTGGWWPCSVVHNRSLLFLVSTKRPIRRDENDVLVHFFEHGCMAYVDPNALFDFFGSMLLKYLVPKSKSTQVEKACEAALKFSEKKFDSKDKSRIEDKLVQLKESHEKLYRLELKSRDVMQQLDARNKAKTRNDHSIAGRLQRRKARPLNTQDMSTALSRRSTRLKRVQKEEDTTSE